MHSEATSCSGSACKHRSVVIDKSGWYSAAAKAKVNTSVGIFEGVLQYHHPKSPDALNLPHKRNMRKKSEQLVLKALDHLILPRAALESECDHCFQTKETRRAADRSKSELPREGGKERPPHPSGSRKEKPALARATAFQAAP